MRAPAGLAPLGHRNFALYFVGQLVSQAGTWIEVTATAYLLYAITGSPVLLGLAGLVRAVPIVALALLGGAVADRTERRRLLVFTQGAQVLTSLLLGTLVATGAVQFWHIYLVGLVNSTLAAFDGPARQAFFPTLVPRSQFGSAVALNGTIFRTSSLVGPAIAGLLIAGAGPASPFFVNALSYLAIIGGLLSMRVGPIVPRGPQPSLRAAALAGIRYARRTALVPLLLATETSLSIFGHNSALVTIFARDVLHAGPEGLGLLLSSIGGGAICGTLALVAFGDIRRKGALMVGAGALYAGAMLAFALSDSFILSVAVLFALGVADAVWGAIRNTILQLAAADAYRGRVMALNLVVNRGLSNASQLETGAVIAAAGPVLGAALNALAVALTVATVALRSPRLRAFRSPARVEITEAAAPGS